MNLLRHLAVIMDGNGRWAKRRVLPRTDGHKRGAQVIDTLCEFCLDRGVRTLTIYAFSTENWARPPLEVRFLMNLLGEFLVAKEAKFLQNGIRFVAIGDVSRFSADLQEKIAQLQARTRGCERLNLAVALNYGGRDEIVRAVRRVAAASAARLAGAAEAGGAGLDGAGLDGAGGANSNLGDNGENNSENNMGANFNFGENGANSNLRAGGENGKNSENRAADTNGAASGAGGTLRGAGGVLREIFTETSIDAALDTAGFGDVDLLIRTGGERRLSNFLLWQASYAELAFSDTLFPDLTRGELEKIAAKFERTHRRFGGL